MYYDPKDWDDLRANLQSILDRMTEGIDTLREYESEIACANDMLTRVRKAKDKQLKALTVVNATSKACSLKWTLRNVYEMNSRKSTDSLKAKEAARRAEDATRAWALMTKCVRIEYKGYELLGEEEACYECLSQYAIFLFENKLYERDVVFWLFSNLPVKDSEPLLNEDLIRTVCDYCNCFS